MKKTACLIAAITISNTIAVSNTIAAYDMSEIHTYTKGTYSVINGDILYQFENGICSAHIYFGTGTELIIPEEVDGVPVTKCSIDMLNWKENLNSITFPSTMTDIFLDLTNTPNLKEIVFLGKNITFNTLSNISSLPIEEITLPVSSLGDNIFSGSTSLKKVHFTGDESVKIGSNAFKDCTALEEITFLDKCSNIEIGTNAFENTAIKNLNFSAPCTIDVNAFSNCNNLKTVTFENDAHISFNAFRDCKELTQISVNGDISLDKNSFLDCQKLNNINIKNHNNLAGAAFNGCVSLTHINNTPVFDENLCDFTAEFKDTVFDNFCATNDVGFINQFVLSSSEKIVSENIAADISDIEKVKILHDWVCKHTSYGNYDPNAFEQQNDAGIFMGKEVVCEGYARTLNLLLNAADFETYYVSSSDHAWNIVKVNNNYFHVDPTWDDGETISHDWFMKSDRELKESGGSHAEWKLNIPSSLHSFQKDVLPECKYSMGDVNTDEEINIADLVCLQNHILRRKELNNENWIMSDLTFDGIIDTFDVVMLRRKLTNTTTQILN